MGEQWSKCFEKPAKGIASRNRRAMPAYQCPLARRNQKVGSPGRICRRLCAGSIATCGPLSSLPSQQWMTPDPRQTPKKSSSIVASPALVAAALTPFPPSNPPESCPLFAQVSCLFTVRYPVNAVPALRVPLSAFCRHRCPHFPLSCDG